MKFDYELNSGLPQLAWVAECHLAGDNITVLHGTGVEVRDSFFDEGVWDGPFSGGFSATDCI